MAVKPKPKVSPEEQFRQFQETAEALECDPDQERFLGKLRKIATAKPAAEKPPRD